MDFLAAALTLIASHLVVLKKWQGYVIHIINVALWTYIMWTRELWGFVALEGVFLAQMCWGLYRWRKEARCSK